MKHKKTRLVITITSSALLAGSLASAADKPVQPPNKDSHPAILPAARLAAMDRAEISKLLSKIEKSTAPESKMGAMCYSPAVTPPRLEYVCPACGEKTLHPSAVSIKYGFELDACRRLYKELPRREGIMLDESSFCKKCQPKAKSPELKLVLRFSNGKTHVARNITGDDLRMLKAFLSGELSYATFNDGRAPLKQVLPRLYELVGKE